MAETLGDRLLVLTPTGRDASVAQAVLEEAGVRAHVCADAYQLCAEIKRGAGAALVAEEALDEVALGRLAVTVDGQPPWSDLPLLIFPSLGEKPPEDVLEPLAGVHNVTLLQRPVSVPSLVTAVRAALRARQRQYELRDVLAHLEQDVRQRDRFLAMLGHELRNPLGAIRNALHVLQLTRASEDPEHLHLAIIQRQAVVLSRLVDDLLDVARVTTGKIALQRSALDFKDLALRCLQAVQAVAQAQGLSLRLIAGPEPVVVFGDATRLEQVLMNLVGNALKYTPTGGRVEVELRAEDGRAVLAVRDTGVGLSADVLPRVFDLFVQAEDTLARAQGGMGIGLTLVRSLVQAHSGTVAVSSEGRDRGCTFTVRLPLVAAPAAPANAGTEATATRLRILVVEDNADNRESLVLLLRQLGHDVDAADDGLSGLERIAHTRPQVALVDIGLPGLDGYEVARRARERVGRDTYLVALTGYGQPEDQRRAQQAGFDAHLTKPLTLDGLTGLLRRVGTSAG